MLLRALGRKVFGLAMIMNSMVSMSSAASALVIFYISGQTWHPYSPCLLSGWVFWFVVLSAGLNISSAKLTGRANIRRVLFHHYVYGFLVSSSAFILVLFFAPASILFLLEPALGLRTTSLQGLSVYVGLFFVYAGISLVIDDSHDFLPRKGRVLGKPKARASSFKRTLKAVHVCSCLVSMYVASCILFWYVDHSYSLAAWPLRNLSYLILVPNLLVTCLWGLNASIRGLDARLRIHRTLTIN
jgi:hypothetical protein